MWFFDMRSNIETVMVDQLRGFKAVKWVLDMEHESMKVKILWKCDQLVTFDGVRELDPGINKAFDDSEKNKKSKWIK